MVAVASVNITQIILDTDLWKAISANCRPRFSSGSKVRHGAQYGDIHAIECTKEEANINQINQLVWSDQNLKDARKKV